MVSLFRWLHKEFRQLDTNNSGTYVCLEYWGVGEWSTGVVGYGRMGYGRLGVLGCGRTGVLGCGRMGMGE